MVPRSGSEDLTVSTSVFLTAPAKSKTKTSRLNKTDKPSESEGTLNASAGFGRGDHCPIRHQQCVYFYLRLYNSDILLGFRGFRLIPESVDGATEGGRVVGLTQLRFSDIFRNESRQHLCLLQDDPERIHKDDYFYDWDWENTTEFGKPKAQMPQFEFQLGPGGDAQTVTQVGANVSQFDAQLLDSHLNFHSLSIHVGPQVLGHLRNVGSQSGPQFGTRHEFAGVGTGPPFAAADLCDNRNNSTMALGSGPNSLKLADFPSGFQFPEHFLEEMTKESDSPEMSSKMPSESTIMSLGPDFKESLGSSTSPTHSEEDYETETPVLTTTAPTIMSLGPGFENSLEFPTSPTHSEEDYETETYMLTMQ